MTVGACYDCPRQCGVDRTTRLGFCGCGVAARIAKTVDPFEHEEPCVGTVAAVFFGGCSLKCSYCQNHRISRGAVGEELSDARLAKLFDGTQNRIDLVTPTHFIGAIERALPLCKRGHSFIYNTSGYETIDGVHRAAEFSDVFLADFKYADVSLAERFSAAPDYVRTAKAALKEMRRISDEWTNVDGKPTMKRGLIVRHLVLPGQVDNSIAALDFIAKELGTDTTVSIMSQFTPNGVGEPSARLKKLEYKIVVEHAAKLGLNNGYTQAFESADPSYTPEF